MIFRSNRLGSFYVKYVRDLIKYSIFFITIYWVYIEEFSMEFYDQSRFTEGRQ